MASGSGPTQNNSNDIVGGIVFVVVCVIAFCINWRIGLAVLIGFLILGVVLEFFDRYRCPNTSCQAWGSVKAAGTKVIAKEKRYGLVTRTARGSSDGYGPGGQHVSGWSSTSWQERVPVIRTTLHHISRCERCGHEFFTVQVTEEEDFSRP